MQELRKIIAENISSLRTSASMTQAGLAEILNYTDKAVSKWERGEAIPDVTVLKEIADYFGVTVDYLLRADHTGEENPSAARSRAASVNRFIITMISLASIWIFAAIGFVILMLSNTVAPPWLAFVYAVPVCGIVLLVLNSIWGIRKLNFLVVSLILWSILASVYLSILMLGGLNLWMLFIIGAPAQTVILFVPGFRPSGKKRS